jgi:hypothetical protein
MVYVKEGLCRYLVLTIVNENKKFFTKQIPF